MRTLVLGLAHFVDKYGYIAEVYARNNESIKFLSMDVSGNSVNCARSYNALLVLVKKSKLQRIWTTIRELVLFRPEYVEVYDIGRLTIIYAILTKVFRKHLTILLIGGELDENHQSDAFAPLSWRLKQYLLKCALMLSDVIIAKEEHMRQKLADRRIERKKVYFIGNAVPVPKYSRTQKSIDFLYLNAVIRQRHVDIMVKAIHALHLKGETFSSTIVGFSSLGEKTDHQRDPTEEGKVLSLIEQLHLNDIICTESFTNRPFDFYRVSKFFVLPGEVIYANYALLEAMSHGVIPIIFSGEGASRIVEDGIDGLIFYSLSPESLSQALVRAMNMTNEETEAMSRKARQKVIDHFSIDEWYTKVKSAKTG